MNSMPLLATAAVAILAVAAIVAVVIVLQRSNRLTGVTVGVSTTAAVAIVAGALLLGSTLTVVPPAVAETPVQRATAEPVDPAVQIQLPTLADEPVE